MKHNLHTHTQTQKEEERERERETETERQRLQSKMNKRIDFTSQKKTNDMD